MRNLVKTGNLDKLSKTAYLTIRNEQINFEIYYMSCNLNHVLYDERNLDIHMKNNKADVFADQFEGKEIEFIKFL